jgi:hypothetical protein
VVKAPHRQSYYRTVIMPASTPNILNPNILRSIVEHVFMPPQLPQEDPGEQMVQEMNVALCDNLIKAAEDFSKYLPSGQSPLWKRMIKMMDLARRAASVPFGEAYLQGTLSDMKIEGLSNIPPFFTFWVRSFAIRCICDACPRTKCLSYRAQACHR